MFNKPTSNPYDARDTYIAKLEQVARAADDLPETIPDRQSDWGICPYCQRISRDDCRDGCEMGKLREALKEVEHLIA